MIKNFHLYLIISVCYLLLGTATQTLANNEQSEHELISQTFSANISEDLNPTLLAQRNNTRAELDAFFNSKYNYCDTKILSQYWGQSISDTKARIGRKVLWRDGGIPYLEQYLVTARIKAIRGIYNGCSYADEGYTYDDAVALSRFWGESSPWEAKQRIENNLMLGKQEEIDSALRRLGRR
jgi:hypothetical protein